jgi:DNA primase
MVKGTRFTPQLLDDIRARVSLVDVVRQAVPLKRKGRSWWGCCPFHNEKSPSFHVKEDEGFYHCFGCGAHGDVITFAQETRGGTFPETVEYLAGLAGVRLQTHDVDPAQQKRRDDGHAALEKATTYFERHLGGEALAYLHKRGLSDDTIKTFRLGWAPDGWQNLKNFLTDENFSPEIQREVGLTLASDKGKGDYDRFRARVMFPICDLKGRPIAFGGRVLDGGEPKYLNSSETPFFNKSQTLYGLHLTREHIRKEKEALLVEGYMDVVSLWQQGVRTAVAPMGTAVTEDQVSFLWRYHDSPTVCLDGDKAGQMAARRLARRVLGVLGPGKTLRFALMPDGEDPDSFVKKQGAEAFRTLIQTTLGIEDMLWLELTDGRDLTSADDRAAIEAELRTLTQEIKNDTVRYHYFRALKDRLWQVSGPTAARKSPLLKGGARATVDVEHNKRVLLALLLVRPDALPFVEEAFARMTFVNEREKPLQSALLRLLREKTLEKEKLDTYLLTTGIKRAADELLANLDVTTLVNAEGLSGTTPDAFGGYWMSLWHQVQLTPKRKREKSALLDTCADAITHDREAWKKLIRAP